MLGQGRINAFWWRCRLNWRRELPRTQRLACLRKRRGSFSWRGGSWARGGMSLPRVCSVCWPLLLESQHWAAVANGSRLYAKGTHICPEFGHNSIQMQPKRARIPRKCNLILCNIRPNCIQMQPKLVPTSVNNPSTCQHRWWNGRQRRGACGVWSTH